MLEMILFIVVFVIAVVVSFGFFSKTKKEGTDHFEKAMAKGYADLRIMQEHERRKMQVKTWSEIKLDREIRSGIVIDPGGQCLCRRCGHTLSAVFDHCINCNATINWNVC